MKYIFIVIFLLILFITFTITYLKKISSKNKVILPNTKITLPKYEEKIKNNDNPKFQVQLISKNKEQLNIDKSHIGETLRFTIAKNKKINVYNTQNKIIGQIAIKDYKSIPLIADHPNYFKGEIARFEKQTYTLKKVIINIQVKVEYSKPIFLLDKAYLNTLITLNSLFEINQVVETNYGAATIININTDHIIADVPSLGIRKIYDIESILKN